MAACTSKSPSGQIDSMQKRLTRAEAGLEVVYNEDFNFLIERYKALDTLLPFNENERESLSLMGAYLQQLETMRPIMQNDINFSRQQLSDLKDDFISGALTEEKVIQYMADEEAALHKIEAQVKYFQEKFNEQKKVAKELAK